MSSMLRRSRDSHAARQHRACNLEEGIAAAHYLRAMFCVQPRVHHLQDRVAADHADDVSV